jgi:hypothetical protein
MGTFSDQEKATIGAETSNGPNMTNGMGGSNATKLNR